MENAQAVLILINKIRAEADINNPNEIDLVRLIESVDGTLLRSEGQEERFTTGAVLKLLDALNDAASVVKSRGRTSVVDLLIPSRQLSRYSDATHSLRIMVDSLHLRRDSDRTGCDGDDDESMESTLAYSERLDTAVADSGTTKLSATMRRLVQQISSDCDAANESALDKMRCKCIGARARYALIEAGGVCSLVCCLSDPVPAIRKTALLVLNQLSETARHNVQLEAAETTETTETSHPDVHGKPTQPKLNDTHGEIKTVVQPECVEASPSSLARGVSVFTEFAGACAVGALIGCIRDRDADNREVALGALANLAATTEDDDKQIICGAGGAAAIVRCISEGRASMRRLACSALADLSNGYEDNKIAVLEAGATHPLVSALSDPSEPVRAAAATALDALAGFNEETIKGIFDAGVIPRLCFNLCDPSERVRLATVRVVYALACYTGGPEVRKALRAARVDETLTRLLEDESVEVRTEADEALRCVRRPHD
eukprot:Rmarinus@m.23650